MKGLFYSYLLSMLCLSFPVQAYTGWVEGMKDLIYTPRYFGPNAFPLPELVGGKLPSHWAFELRGEYYQSVGDKTQDIFTHLYVPIAKGKAAFSVDWVVYEHYKLTPERKLEVHAAELTSPISYSGDVIFHCYYQILNSKRIFDMCASINLKTASGGRLCDARFTDAATYWIDTHIGRDLYTTPSFSLRALGMVGFYCWMTNDIVHRQNDALLYGLGLSAYSRHFCLKSDLSGFHGYENEGDRPLSLRMKLSYNLKKNAISFRYSHGLKDTLFDLYSLAYTRSF